MKTSIMLLFLTVASVFSSKLYALEDTYFTGQKLDVPMRENAIIVSDTGFYPNRIVVFRGEKVKFYVTNISESAQCFNIPDKNVYTTAQKGKIAEGEAFFDKSGVFLFNCPNTNFQGRVIVMEKAQDMMENTRRGLASDKVKIWKPKEEPSEWMEVSREEFKKKFGDIMDLDSQR